MDGGKRSMNKKGNVQDSENAKTMDEIVESLKDLKVEGSTNAAASLDDEKLQTISQRQMRNRAKKTAGPIEEKGAAQEQANIPDQSGTNADLKDGSTNNENQDEIDRAIFNFLHTTSVYWDWRSGKYKYWLLESDGDTYWNVTSNKHSSRNNDRSGDYHFGNSARSYYGESSDKKSGQFQDDFDESKRTTDTRSKRSGSHNREDYDDFGPNTNRNYQGSSGDKEFDEFRRVSKQYSEDSFVKVKEIQEDLFKMPEEYALAHCVAEDMSMERGIAVQFSQQFKSHYELYQQKQKQGGLAVLSVGKGRFIYYLVTKKLSNGMPTMYTMWCSLRKLQQHMEENKVHKLAIPRIGCELNGLEWSEVKAMIEYVFRNTDVNITVCNFQQPEGEAAAAPPKSGKCLVKNVPYSLADVDVGTAIIYLGSEDGHVSEEIRNLDKKFNLIRDYKMENKQIGKVLQMYKQNKNYCLYGFIVAKSKHDAFRFADFQKCVMKLRKLNKDFHCVAMEAFLNGELIMNKVVNLLSCYLFNDVYVCWPGRMQEFMPVE